MMKRNILMLLAALVLSGCSTFAGTAQDAVEHARDAGDAALVAAEFALCDVPRVGAVRRRYGGNERLMTAWRLFCTTRLAAEVVQPTIPQGPSAGAGTTTM